MAHNTEWPNRSHSTPTALQLRMRSTPWKTPKDLQDCNTEAPHRSFSIALHSSARITNKKQIFSQISFADKPNRSRYHAKTLAFFHLREILSRDGRSHRLDEPIEVPGRQPERRRRGADGRLRRRWFVGGLDAVLHLTSLRRCRRRCLRLRRSSRSRRPLPLQLLLLELPADGRRVVEPIGAVAAGERDGSGSLHLVANFDFSGRNGRIGERKKRTLDFFGEL